MLLIMLYVCVELTDKSIKIHKVNVSDITVTYLLINCLPDKKAFGHAAKYQVHLKLMEDLYWSLNQNCY